MLPDAVGCGENIHPNDMTLRDQLIDIIRTNSIKQGLELDDHSSLIKSGRIDSMALFHLASWIEKKLDRELDFTDLDITKEWDTVADILNFLERQPGDVGQGRP